MVLFTYKHADEMMVANGKQTFGQVRGFLSDSHVHIHTCIQSHTYTPTRMCTHIRVCARTSVRFSRNPINIWSEDIKQNNLVIYYCCVNMRVVRRDQASIGNRNQHMHVCANQDREMNRKINKMNNN